jgi:hypothetical protein
MIHPSPALRLAGVGFLAVHDLDDVRDERRVAVLVEANA